MKDVQIINTETTPAVRFEKRLWDKSELLLAKCYNFHMVDTKEDTTVITAYVWQTSKMAMYEFIRLSFKSFSESAAREQERNDFYQALDNIWAQRDAYVDELLGKRIPYTETLYQHQKIFLRESFFKKDVFLSAQMGLGKTIMSATVSRLHQTPRTVIICPAAVKYNWFRDLQKFGFNPVYFSIYDATKSRSFKALVERFVIINYDILGKFGEDICKHRIDHFILDESHSLKNHTSHRFKNVFKMISLNPEARITFLSGTPITNRVNDIFAYLKLTGSELGQSHKKFLDQYTIRANSRGGDRVTGGKNLDDLRIKLANFMMRFLSEDWLDLPEKIFLMYSYGLDDYREEYNRILTELSQIKDRNKLTGNLHSLNIITSMAKIPGIIEIANSIMDEGRKVVIFSSYKEPLNTLEKQFAGSCVKIDGSVSSFDRDRLVQLFIEDPNIKVFLGNMVAAGVGINLVNASDVVFVNYPLVPSELNQCIYRCIRIGQKNNVKVHLTMCEDSIDEVLHHLILDKEMEATTVLDGKASETLMRENFTEVLIKMLLGESIVTEPVVEEPLFEVLPPEPTQPSVPVVVSLPPSNDLPNFL